MTAHVIQTRIGPLDSPRRGTLLEILGLWYRRSQDRRHLAELDDRLLNDLGIDRAQANFETAKPFWRA